MSTIQLPDLRIALRPIRRDDVDAILTWINDPEVTRNFARMSEPITRDEELTFLDRMIASETDHLYAIVDHDGAYLGNAGIHKIHWPSRNGRLGIVLGMPGSRGRGLGGEVLQLLLHAGFAHLDLHKLWVIHYATNERMHHIVQKAGFILEGRLRDEYRHDGAWHDMLRWGRLTTDPPP